MKYLKKYWTELLIFSFFLLLTLVMIYPTILELKSSFYGKPADPLGSIWQLWWLKYAIWQKHISPNFCPLLAAPFGIDLTSLMNRDIFSNHFMRLPLLFLDEVIAFNLFLLLTFLLSAITMYFLACHFTKNRLTSMVTGIMYAFCPYHLTHAQQHFGLAQIQWMPLYILLLFKLDEKRTYKYALLCALAFSLNLFSDIHYGYFMLIFTATFVLWRVWQEIRKRRAESREQRAESGERRAGSGEKNSTLRAPSAKLHSFKVILVTVFAALIFTLPFTYPILKTLFTTPQTKLIAFRGDIRPLRDLFGNAARPLGYLLPSQENPIFGGYTKRFVKSPFYGGHPVEHTLYLGWVGIVLSIVAVREWRRKNREQRLSGYQVIRLSGEKKNRSPITDYRSQRGMSFFLFAGIVALLFSHSPYTEIGNFRIFFPSYFMYKALPMFRVCARFGIVVMLCVSVLAGIGLTSILEKIKNVKKRRVFLSIVLLLILIEFAPTRPAPMVNAVNPPPVYEWLAKQEGDFIIAEYPLGNNQEYQFWQRIHQKRLINGAQPRTYADEVRKEIVDILKLETPGTLKYLGAKYIILHPGKYLKSEDVPVIGEVPDVSKQKGLRLVKTFEEARVYEVVARPVRPKAEKAGKWAGE